MVANPRQFVINYQKDMMKNIVILVISVDVIISVTLQAEGELNAGHLVINSSSGSPWREMMEFSESHHTHYARI
jgi:hypothetical protein